MSGRAYLTALAQLHAVADREERRRVARQGIAMLAQIAEREPAPLEGLAAGELLLSVRAALDDGLLAQLDWLAPAAGAIVLFELAQALPPGPERRELGRRVLVQLRDGDRDTFVRLLTALARSSPKLLASEALRARTEVVLAAPLTAPGAVGALALALLAQPALAQTWVETPASGSLPHRRLAARILAHGAREAVRRHDAGDRGGASVLARPGARAALARLLADREALVWRFAGIARGLLAHVDPELADDIDRELRAAASSTELRRGAASAAAALERGGAALRWQAVVIERAAREPAVARGALLGLAGLAVAANASADELAVALIERAPLDAVQGLAELRREEGADLLPRATEAARSWAAAQLAAHATAGDDGRWGLLHALAAELAPEPVAVEGVGVPLAAARAALDAGDITAALRHARAAVDELAAAADWLERASDDDAVDRRHSTRLLRELDRELLADNTLTAVLALAPEGDQARVAFARALAAIERSLLAREVRPEAGAVEHGGLRIARLRALVRLLDGVRASGEADLAPRLAAVRQLMTRAAEDHSSLRRAVWAALTRAGDALVRDGHAELTDLLLAWTLAFPDEDFAVVREATMVPEIEAAFAAYARLHQATWAASDPDDGDALRGVVERLGELADALPPEQTPRVESVRLALARFGNQLARLASVASQAALPADTFDAIATELGALARRVYGARQRLGLPGDDRGGELEQAARSVGDVLVRLSPKLEETIMLAIESARVSLPPAVAAAIERALLWLARRPRVESANPTAPRPRGDGGILPGWVPLSRLLGGFHVLRPIGRGGGGSVLLAVRSDERLRADRELVALKVPDYSGDAARNLSEAEFEALFREEAGALIALPQHNNLARFITFDASAQPKPILVMEFVPGLNLERTLAAGDLDTPRALAIIDGLLSGLDAMHHTQIAHLDIKPANIVLREGTGSAVLVDFGLAGRRLRTGCGSAHYGAAEVWIPSSKLEPFATDVYAASCIAYELLTNQLLVRGDNLKDVMAAHFATQPAQAVLAELDRTPRLAPLADLLRAGVARDPRKRPSAARLRAGFAAIAPDLKKLAWPVRA
jgi:eukaryotic-like serine/threonine-protein kinase